MNKTKVFKSKGNNWLYKNGNFLNSFTSLLLQKRILQTVNNMFDNILLLPNMYSSHK